MPSILTPDLGLLFWMLLAFLVVFFVLAKFGFPAIIGMVEKRKKYIDESLSKAQKAAAQLENIKQESESMLQEARGSRPPFSRRLLLHVRLSWHRHRRRLAKRVLASSMMPRQRLKARSRLQSARFASR